jgi:hypothetical protein
MAAWAPDPPRALRLRPEALSGPRYDVAARRVADRPGGDVSSKQHHSESGRTRNERRKHDEAVKHHEEQVYTADARPKWVLWVLYALIAIVLASLTLLFMAGWIKW